MTSQQAISTQKPDVIAPVLDYATQQRKGSKHLLGLSIVVLTHLALLWIINSGLGKKFVKVVKGPVEAILLEEKKPLPPPSPTSPPPPSRPQPDKKTPPLSPPLPPPPPAYVPPVDVPVTAQAGANAVSAVTSAPAVPPAPPPSPGPLASPPPAPAPPVKTAAVARVGNCEEEPPYPAASQRNDEEGVVVMRMLVGLDGKVIRAEVERSSGYSRLDEAVKSILPKCTFKPAMTDGKPEEGWARLSWKFQFQK